MCILAILHGYSLVMVDKNAPCLGRAAAHQLQRKHGPSLAKRFSDEVLDEVLLELTVQSQ